MRNVLYSLFSDLYSLICAYQYQSAALCLLHSSQCEFTECLHKIRQTGP